MTDVRSWWKRISERIGPGVITGAAVRIVASPLIAVAPHVANNEKVMGKWGNGKWANILGVMTLIVMTLAGLGLLLQ